MTASKHDNWLANSNPAQATNTSNDDYRGDCNMVSYSRQVRKGGRQFEKDRKVFFLECKAEHRPCWLCGMPIDYDAPQNTTDDSFNLDHFYPVTKRPDLQHDPAGFRPSHTQCNNLRGNKDPATPIGTLSRQWIKTA